MQRLRTNDLTGHLMQKKKQKWTLVRIPMEYELATEPGFNVLKDLGAKAVAKYTKRGMAIKDPRTKAGELMFPERFPRAAVEALKEDLGTYGTAGQLQQRPNPKGGGILKKHWWRKWPAKKAMPLCVHIVASYDTAYTIIDLKENSYSARTTWGIFNNEETGKPNMILLEGWFDRVDYPELRKLAKKHHYDFECDRAMVEKKASGQSLIQDMRKIRIPVYGHNPGKLDKVARTYVSQPTFEAGMVWYPDRAWAEEIIDHVADFPNGAPPSGDLNDTVTQAVMYMKNRWWITPPDEEDNIEPTDPSSEEWDEDNEAVTPGGAYG